MKRYYYILVLGALALGCTRQEVMTVAPRVAVALSGELSPAGAQTRGEGMIDPIAPFYPPKQLEIGIMSIEIDSTSPVPADWGDEDYSSYLDRGFFGGNEIGDSPTSMGEDWNGNIEFTNRAGTALQDVFYNPTGEYYHFVCVYPYEDIINPDDQEAMRSAEGVTVCFNIDGSGDIMASTCGKGNIDYPWGADYDPVTNPTAGTVTFYHKLTALRCKFKAESEMAVSLYGTINSVELVGQPDVVGLNIGANALDDTTPLIDQRTTPSGISYPAVGSDGTAVTTPLTIDHSDAITFGYMMALPAQTYTFKITTSVHGASNPLYVTYDFMTATTPIAKPAAGTIYNLTFTMMESDKIVLAAAEAKDWYLNQTFD